MEMQKAFSCGIKNVKIGDIIKFPKREDSTPNYEEYICSQSGKVIAIYPHHVLIQCKHWKQAVNIGTLVQLGLEFGGGSLFDYKEEGYENGAKWW